MIAGTGLVCIAVFALAMSRFHVTRAGSQALATAKGALTIFSDDRLDDHARERAARQASIELLSASAAIAIRSALAVAVSLVPLALADRAGLARVHDVVSFLSRWEVIAAVSVAFIAGYLVRDRAWRST